MEGVSTRRVDDLVKALGCDGISSSQVSRICQQLDEVVDSFLGRPLDGGPYPYPYVWLDGLTQKLDFTQNLREATDAITLGRRHPWLASEGFSLSAANARLCTIKRHRRGSRASCGTSWTLYIWVVQARTSVS